MEEGVIGWGEFRYPWARDCEQGVIGGADFFKFELGAGGGQAQSTEVQQPNRGALNEVSIAIDHAAPHGDRSRQREIHPRGSWRSANHGVPLVRDFLESILYQTRFISTGRNAGHLKCAGRIGIGLIADGLARVNKVTWTWGIPAASVTSLRTEP